MTTRVDPTRVSRADAARALTARPAAWVEVGLTAPLFLLYHIGIVFLDVRNGADFLTQWLMVLSKGDPLRYVGLTFAVFVVFVGVFAYAGRGQVFVARKFLQMLIEGAVYAFAMAMIGSRVVSAVFGAMWRLDLPPMVPDTLEESLKLLPDTLPLPVASGAAGGGPFVGFVMSLGAGFYEELVFRVILFGAGLKLILLLFAKRKIGLFGPEQRRWDFGSVMAALCWALICAAIFSGVHYIGSLGDPFSLRSFVYRFVLGLVLTLIFVTRGFAVAVWTHALYDVWVMVLS